MPVISGDALERIVTDRKVADTNNTVTLVN